MFEQAVVEQAMAPVYLAMAWIFGFAFILLLVWTVVCHPEKLRDKLNEWLGGK